MLAEKWYAVGPLASLGVIVAILGGDDCDLFGEQRRGSDIRLLWSEIRYNSAMAREVLKFSRVLHLYFGVFISPAESSFLRLQARCRRFGLHEANRDHPDYKPARWIVVLGLTA